MVAMPAAALHENSSFLPTAGKTTTFGSLRSSNVQQMSIALLVACPIGPFSSGSFVAPVNRDVGKGGHWAMAPLGRRRRPWRLFGRWRPPIANAFTGKM